jgi:hypothetical protein
MVHRLSVCRVGRQTRQPIVNERERHEHPFTGEVDPAYFTAVQILAIGTRADGSRFADYAARGYGARGDLDQFVPRSAVKRVTVDGRRRLAWR